MDVDEVVRIHLKNAGVDALISASDYEVEKTVELSAGLSWTGRICDVNWRGSVKSHTTYVTCILLGSVELRLHRLILEAKRGQIVDHIDRNGLNNVRENLRLVTARQNCANRSATKDTSSQFKGVCWSKPQQCWHAYIRVDRKKIHLGTFHDETEAAKAYDEAARKHFGDHACLNLTA